MHAGARLGSQWQRRKPCVQGPLRRAHPASGATWNVQVVRGKVTSKCLWHACRALSLGLLLMLLGAAMATIGYYADQLSVGQEIRGNATVRVKNESRGFHLNNLSYAGPIVMGVGGFIVVAACVMTFEARDSAAKVVPARFKMAPGKVRQVAAAARRSAGSQTGRWEQHLGVFKSSPTTSDRRALTAALLQFSKNLGSVEHRPSQSSVSSRSPQSQSQSPRQSHLMKCGSVPELRMSEPKSHNTTHIHNKSPKVEAPRRPRPTLLNPAMLQRQALSVDESHVRCSRFSHESLAGSQGSMAMDLHVPCEGPVTLRVRDSSRTSSRSSRTGVRPPNTRSDTARRHMLARQRPIDDDENHGHSHDRSHSPRSHRSYSKVSRENSLCIAYDNRRSSNVSDTDHSRRMRHREMRLVTIRRSASTSPQPRRIYKKPPPCSLDLGHSAHPICEDNNSTVCVSPDMATSEYHTVCDDYMVSISNERRASPLRYTNSSESRDSRYSTETGTLHTAAEINMSESTMEFDNLAGTPTSSQTENDADYDLTEDITPTYNSDVTSSKNDDNDASTVIDVACVDPLDLNIQEEEEEP